MGNNKSSHKLTREEKEKAVELAIAGKDPIGYLKECGCKNPWASWAYIKQTLKKSKPELYAKLPSDDDRLDEEVSFGAQDKPPVPADEPEAADPLEGFTAFDPGAGKKPIKGNEKEFIERLADTVSSAMDPGAPDGDKAADLVINAEDLAAAEDPAVKRMEAMTAEAEPVVEKKSMGLDEAVQKMEEALKSPDFMEIRQTADGFTIRKRKPDFEKTTFFGIPCDVTGMKVEEFEFRRTGNDLMMDYPGPGLLWMDKSLATVKLTVEQWKRVIELVPKVMKIFGMD